MTSIALPRLAARPGRLRRRLYIYYASLFALILVLTAIAAQFVIARMAERDVGRALASSNAVFDRLWDQRAGQYRDLAGLLWRDGELRRAALAGRDAAVRQALDDLRVRLDAAGLRLTLNGHPAYFSGNAALAGQPGPVAVVGDRVFRRVSLPIDGGEIAIIRELGSAELDMVMRISPIPLEAAVIRRDGDGHWRGGGATIANGIVQRAFASGDGQTTLALPAGVSIASIRPLAADAPSDTAALMLSYPIADAMTPFRTIQHMMLVAGLAGLALVLFGSWAIARQITRPIVLLDAAVKRLREGSATTVPISGDDEIARLAESFNEMARVAHLAFHDPLTGLPNRARFRETLTALLDGAAETVSLLCIDLDGFKAVNDGMGHPVGDEVLKIVARRMESVISGANVARLGGDEFTLILADRVEDEAERVAALVIDAVRQPAIIDGNRIRIGASVGIAHFPRDAANASDLMRKADQALYIAKAAGRGVAHSFVGG